MDDKKRGEEHINYSGEDDGSDENSKKAIVSPSYDEALKRCLEKNKGEDDKCKSQLDALKSSLKPPIKPLAPLRLRSGSLTDV